MVEDGIRMVKCGCELEVLRLRIRKSFEEVTRTSI